MIERSIVEEFDRKEDNRVMEGAVRLFALFGTDCLGARCAVFRDRLQLQDEVLLPVSGTRETDM